MTVEKTQENLSTTLDKTEQALGGLETALDNNEEASLLATAENSEANDGLPEGWINTNIGDVASVNSGVGFPKKYQGHLEGDYPVYKVGDVSKAFLNAKGKLSIAGNYVSAATALEMKGKVFPVGATAFAKIGEAVRLNRRVLIQRQGLADNNVMVVKSDQSCMDYYVYQFLRTQSLDDVTQSTTVPSVRKGDIEELKFPLPPLAEQTVIAQTLDTLLAQVDNIKTRLDAIPNILKTFRQSVLAAAVSGKLTEEWRGGSECEAVDSTVILKEHQEFHISKLGRYKEPDGLKSTDGLSKLPDTWKWYRAEQLCDLITKGTTPSKNKMSSEGKVPYIKVYNLTFDGSLDFTIEPTFISQETSAIELKRSRVYPGDVLMNIVGPPLGKVSIVPSSYPEWNINQAIAIFRSVCGVSNKFLSTCLRDNYLLELTKAKAKATVGQSNLTLEICRDYSIPVPPLEEQTQIVHRVEVLFAFADQIEQQVKNAQGRVNNLTQSILAKAFRGELTSQWRTGNPDLISGENSAEALLAKIQEEREALKQEAKPKKKATRKKSVNK
jgi:type I restriction enzyme S subunit